MTDKEPSPRPFIRRCEAGDAETLMAMIAQEGESWKEYWQGAGRKKYLKVLSNSTAWLIFEEGVLRGYVRCREDDGFGVYVYDLLVSRAFRGRGYGRLLLERVGREYPGEPVYVMSDADSYYEKLGYERIGSIFTVKPNMREG